MVKAIFFALALAASVSAQTAGNLPVSSACSATLLAATNDPDAVSCLNLGGILALATAPAGTSLLPKVDSWLKGLCGAPACQPATLSSLATNLTANCGTDLQSFGGGGLNLNTYISQIYPTARRVACLKDTAASGQFCLTGDLTTIEKALGQPLTLSSTISLGTGSLGVDILPTVIEVTCNTCSQAALSIIQQDQPGLLTPATLSGLQTECGAAFLSGGIPSTITEGLSTTPAKGKSAAMTVTSSVQLLSIVAVFVGAVIGL